MLKIPATICVFGTKAQNEDQNYIEKPEISSYLSSENWKHHKECKNIFISVTHFLRNDAGSEPGLGMSDKLLKDGVIIGRVSDSWISKDGKSWDCDMELFDDLDQYSESQKPMILQILRLVKNGSSIGVSAVLSGEWSDTDGKLIYLDDFIGLDITADPSFKRSEMHTDDLK